MGFNSPNWIDMVAVIARERDMAQVRSERVYRRFGTGEVPSGIDLDIGDVGDVGDVEGVVELALTLPAGRGACGKSTVMRCHAGLDPIAPGDLDIGGKPVNQLAPNQCSGAMAFQSDDSIADERAREHGWKLRRLRIPVWEIAVRVWTSSSFPR